MRSARELSAGVPGGLKVCRDAFLPAKLLDLKVLLEVSSYVAVELRHNAVVAELGLDLGNHVLKMGEKFALIIHKALQPNVPTVVVHENIEVNARAPSSWVTEGATHV